MERGPLVTSEAAAQEADYLIGARLGVDVELAFLDDLAQRFATVRVLTLNERVFRAVTPPHGEAFTLLPADST